MSKTLCIEVRIKEKVGWQAIAEIFKKFNVFGELNCNSLDSGEHLRLYYPIGKGEKAFGSILWLKAGITKAVVNAKASKLNNNNMRIEVSNC